MPLSPYPVTHPIALRSLMASDAWRRWFTDLWTWSNRAITASGRVAATVTSTTPITPVTIQTSAPLQAGLYRISASARGEGTPIIGDTITVNVNYTPEGWPGPTSHRLATIAFSDDGGLNVRGGSITVRLAAGQPVQWFVTVSSAGYSAQIDVVIEAIP